jgi:hypothetical protein
MSRKTFTDNSKIQTNHKNKVCVWNAALFDVKDAVLPVITAKFVLHTSLYPSADRLVDLGVFRV